MSYVNTTRKSRLYIDGVEKTDRMISWSATDSSAMKAGFVLTTGEVVLGTNDLSQFEYQKRKYKRGTEVILEVRNPETGTYERHPRGLLYVTGEVFDPASQIITIEIACKLSLYAMADNPSAVLPLSPLELDESRQTFDNVKNAFASVGRILYQDNQGTLQDIEAFDLDSGAGDPASVPSNWLSISSETTLSLSPLVGASPIPDSIKLSYEFNVSDGGPAEDPEVVTEENTSTYDIKYPGVIFTRVGTTIPTDTTGDGGLAGGSICGNSPQQPASQTPGAGNPGACSGVFATVEEPIKKRTTRRELSFSTYAGVGRQVSEVVKDTYGAAIEVNPQYYADKFAYCRFNYATACNPNGSCSLDGLDEILQSRLIETFTYDKNGTLIERNLEEWRPSLAAAQPFDWRAGVVSGVPTTFTEISPAALFRAKVTNAKFSQENSRNVETITISESSALKSRAGIGATPQEFTQGGILLIGEPTTYPVNVTGTATNVPVTTITGNGTGMTVDISFPTLSGKVQEVRLVEETLDKSAYHRYNPRPVAARFTGGSGINFLGGVNPQEDYNNPQTIYPIEGSDYATQGYPVLGFEARAVGPAGGGLGYKVGDRISWSSEYTSVPSGDVVVSTVILEVTKAVEGEPSITLNEPGTGYTRGDQLKVSAAALAAALGQGIDSGLFFSVVGSADSAVAGGNSIVNLRTERKPQSLNTGHYVNVPVVVESGDGGGASVNIEAVSTGVVTEIFPYQEPTRTPGAPESQPFYELDVAEYAFPDTEGHGTGLKVMLRVGKSISPTNVIPRVITIDRIIDPGSGYINGDIVTIPSSALSGMGIVLEPFTGVLDLKATLRVSQGSVLVFPSSVGSGFQPGDRLTVTNSVLKSIGALSDSSSDMSIELIVNRVSSEIELGSLRLDAAEGPKTVTVNTSSSRSTLPESPDTIASPSVSTESLQTIVTVRAEQYNNEDFAGPLVAEESIPVPLLMKNRDEVQKAMDKYSGYLKRWYLGEALGLQVGEALTPEIVDNWQPMAGFRYIDTTTNTGIALRADSCSWGVDTSEAVVSMNGIWCGNVNYDPSSQV